MFSEQKFSHRKLDVISWEISLYELLHLIPKRIEINGYSKSISTQKCLRVETENDVILRHRAEITPQFWPHSYPSLSCLHITPFIVKVKISLLLKCLPHHSTCHVFTSELDLEEIIPFRARNHLSKISTPAWNS